MKIYKTAFEDIKNTVGTKEAETGGILLGHRTNNIIQKFIYDPYGNTGSAAYDPDVDFLNKQVKIEWEENGLELLGFIHSHPYGLNRLSGDWGNNTGDVGYIKAIFNAMPKLSKFLAPIVFSEYGGQKFKIFPYVAFRGNEDNYIEESLEIIEDNEMEEVMEETIKPKTIESGVLSSEEIENSKIHPKPNK